MHLLTLLVSKSEEKIKVSIPLKISEFCDTKSRQDLPTCSLCKEGLEIDS